MLCCIRQELMLSVLKGKGNEIEGVEIDDDKRDIHEEKSGIGQTKHALYVVPGQEIKRVAFDLQNVNLEKGVDEHAYKDFKLASGGGAVSTLIAVVGDAQDHHADGGDEQEGVGGDGIHVLKKIDCVVKAYRGVDEKDDGAQHGAGGRDIVKRLLLNQGRSDREPARDGAPRAGKQHVQNVVR